MFPGPYHLFDTETPDITRSILYSDCYPRNIFPNVLGVFLALINCVPSAEVVILHPTTVIAKVKGQRNSPVNFLRYAKLRHNGYTPLLLAQCE